MKTRPIFPIILGVLIIVVAGIYIANAQSRHAEKEAIDTSLDLKPVEKTPQPLPVVISNKGNTLHLGELGTFSSISIRPISIEEDSRCPVDVNCIQAGTVLVKIQVGSKLGTSTDIIKLGQVFISNEAKITLTSVTPDKNSKIPITNKDYIFKFNVAKESVPVVIKPKSKCYIGGCSAQICSDDPNAISNCIYSNAYVCYKTATCERQTSGECGWTATPELNACLESNK